MPEPANLGPRRLWRAVIRPLAEEGPGDVVCDVSDNSIVEGLLVTTQATLHAVGTAGSLVELGHAYRDRIVFHPAAAAAWAAAVPCRLAVLDANRSLADHIESLSRLAEEESGAPPVLIQGLGGGRDMAAGALAEFARRGWALVELPGFDQIRLVLPGGRGVVGSATLDRILERLTAGAAGAVDQRRTDEAAERAIELQERVRELERRAATAEADRELAEQRRATADDLVVTLRVFRDEARADLHLAREQTEDMRRQLESARVQLESARAQVESARADLSVARSRVARFSRVHRAVREDLVRLQDSQAWRLGHWLTRAARVLTFRKPGRTDAVAKALERLDAVTPSGDADH